nr:synaptic vesicle glycoprotein 2B-like [Leptinotarsa decemlineata]
MILSVLKRSPSLIIQDDEENDLMENTPAADFETAVHFAKNGRFQKLLLAVCGTVYATCAISTTTLSFVLPSAECDFNLSSMDKGKLSATPLIGMVLGCAVWGAIADSRGRKLALILSLLVDFSAAITSSLAMSFHLFLICRFFNGFGIIGATNIIFSYLGEFLSVKNRDAMLGKLEIFWNFGIVILPDLKIFYLKVLFSQPYLRYLAITSFADFGLMMSYYTLIMWFPEIFSRFYEFEVQHPNLTAGIVEVFQNNATRNNIFFSFLPCDPSIDFRVFLDTFIIGLSCIPTSVSLSYFMKKVGKISVLVFCLMTSGLATLSLIWVRSTWQTLVLSCFFEALTSILESVLFCVVVDLFPTNLRAIALAITAMSGRLGAILGNIIFGILIDINCLIPIYLFGLLLFASGLLCLAIPRTENYIVIH